jgi:hypothetical protein
MCRQRIVMLQYVYTINCTQRANAMHFIIAFLPIFAHAWPQEYPGVSTARYERDWRISFVRPHMHSDKEHPKGILAQILTPGASKLFL